MSRTNLVFFFFIPSGRRVSSKTSPASPEYNKVLYLCNVSFLIRQNEIFLRLAAPIGFVLLLLSSFHTHRHHYALFVHAAKGTRFSLLAFRLSKNEMLQRSEYRAYHTYTYNIMYTAILSTLRGKK